MPAKRVLELANSGGSTIVDLRFIDVPGLCQHFSNPAEDLSEDLFEEGIGFDGSSIRGFQPGFAGGRSDARRSSSPLAQRALGVHFLGKRVSVLDWVETHDPRTSPSTDHSGKRCRSIHSASGPTAFKKHPAV